MVIRQCDRCGNPYKPYRDNGKHKLVPGVNGMAFVHINQNGEYDDGKTDACDLCQECLDAVYKFVHEYKKDAPAVTVPPKEVQNVD